MTRLESLVRRRHELEQELARLAEEIAAELVEPRAAAKRRPRVQLSDAEVERARADIERRAAGR